MGIFCSIQVVGVLFADILKAERIGYGWFFLFEEFEFMNVVVKVMSEMIYLNYEEN